MTIKKIILLSLFIIAIGGFMYGYYQYNKPATNVSELKAKPVTAESLYNDFTSNETHANQLYLNQPLQVTGEVLEIKQNQNQLPQVILSTGDPMFGIACTLDKKDKNIKRGDHVTIKGICTGYLNDVILTRALLL